MINYLLDNVGGGAIEDNRARLRVPCYSFVLTGKLARELLIQVREYLTSKTEEADLGILFQDLRSNGQGVRYTDEQNEMFEDLYHLMRSLKSKGGK